MATVEYTRGTYCGESTLLMLIYAFGGTDLMKQAYEHAVRNQYRFYSYGDACLIEKASL